MSKRAFRKVTHSRLVTATLAAALMAAIGGVAWAAIPDDTGAVHACYRTGDATKPGGATLSVIDTDNHGACKAGQSTLTLAQPGPSSPKAVTGSVEADGSVTDGTDGLSATVLAPG